MLAKLVEKLELANIQISPIGFMNIESGVVSVASRRFESCESCMGTDTESSQFSCAECGRLPDNYFVISCGDGDGIYVVFRLESQGRTVGMMTVFDSNYTLANKYRLELEEWKNPQFSVQDLSPYLKTHFTVLGQIELKSELFVADQFSSLNSTMYVSVPLSKLEPGRYSVFGTFELPEEYSFSDALGPRSVPTLRVLFTLPSEMLGEFDMNDEGVITDWAAFIEGNLLRIETAHKSPLTDDVKQVNARLASLERQNLSKSNSSQIEPESPVIDKAWAPLLDTLVELYLRSINDAEFWNVTILAKSYDFRSSDAPYFQWLPPKAGEIQFEISGPAYLKPTLSLSQMKRLRQLGWDYNSDLNGGNLAKTFTDETSPTEMFAEVLYALTSAFGIEETDMFDFSEAFSTAEVLNLGLLQQSYPNDKTRSAIFQLPDNQAQPSPANNFCRNCGSKLKADSKFCSECGSAV